MSHGFDLDNPLICEGIIGDGCGGGRIFMVKDGVIKAYDPLSKDFFELLEGIQSPISISKSHCIVSVVCQNETIEFDLSSMKRII